MPLKEVVKRDALKDSNGISSIEFMSSSVRDWTRSSILVLEERQREMLQSEGILVTRENRA